MLARIAHVALELVAGAAAGQLPRLVGVSTAPSNIRLVAASTGSGRNGMADGNSNSHYYNSSSGDDGSSAHHQHVLRLGSQVQIRTLLGNGGNQAASIARGACASPLWPTVCDGVGAAAPWLCMWSDA